MNLLAGKPADRVPVALFHHFCPPNEWGKGLENQEAFARSVTGHKLAREKFGPDAIKIMNDTLMIIPADASFEKAASGLHNVHAPAVISLYKKTLELAKRARAFYEDTGAPVYATGFSPSQVLCNNLCLCIPGRRNAGSVGACSTAWVNGKHRHATEAKRTHVAFWRH